MAALITWLSAAVRRDEEGQGLAEYALILALIAIVVIGAVIFLGGADQHHHEHRRQEHLALAAFLKGGVSIWNAALSHSQNRTCPGTAYARARPETVS